MGGGGGFCGFFFAPPGAGKFKRPPPAVIVSNDHANALLNRVQVVPLTSNTNKVFPSEALISVNGRTSKAAADQIRTVSKHRLKERIGTLTSDDMNKVELAILIQLGMA